jgi:Stage II sporulation protein E (SpoIIE)/PAS fold
VDGDAVAATADREVDNASGMARSSDDWPGIVFQPNATSVNAGFFAWEVATGEVICDPVTYRLHGLPDDTSATMDTFLSRVPPSDLPDVVEAMQKMAASCDSYQIEYRVTGHDGTLRSMEARGRMLAGPDGRPARMVGVVMDTTAVRASREAERRRLREGADRALRTHEFTAALASAVTVDEIVTAAREGLRAYGADSLIMIAGDDGRPAVVASCGFDQAAIDALTNFEPSLPTPVADAIAWRTAVYLPSAATLAGDYPHLADLAKCSPQQAWVALPVTDSRDGVGACLIGFPAPREFPPEERALLFAASGLLAQSLERARMYESEHALARELQHGMLPRGALAAAGVTIATRYQAATSGMEIGGDFYDAIELPDGRVALVIGDVQGHNLLAASMMGRLRTAVHAYAREGHGPAAVMARANQWLTGLNTDLDRSLFATCCFVVVRPDTGELAMCRAGHPPPALVTPNTAPRLLEFDGGLPLGIDAGARYATFEIRVPQGTVLVLTTDGLLDADGDDVDYNVRCMLGALENGTAIDLETLADGLLGSPRCPPRHGDDVALLLARLDDQKPVM